MTQSSSPSSPPRAPRRTEGLRVQGRSARVVEDVLSAVIAELGQVGYAALRVEDVAARSGVNKTTIYRRWPSKTDLVSAAIERVKDDPLVFDTGTLRGDLLAMMRDFVARVQTPLGRGIVRMLQAERGDPEVAELLRSLRRRHQQVRRSLFERALARGELPAGTDCSLLVELAMAPVAARVVHLGVEVDERFLVMHVDVLLAGARAGAAIPPAR